MKVKWPLVGAAAAVAVTAVVVLVATNSSGDKNPGGDSTAAPAPTAAAPLTTDATTGVNKTAGKLAIRVTGTCNDPGGMRLQSSGFTPNSGYTTQAWYPNGAAYSYILSGTADDNGTTPKWRWDCDQTANGQPDPAGTYKLVMTDDATGRTANATFVVKY